MADLKISQLSAATALAGTEVVPVVQSGVTKKTTIDQILAPASGKGINFAAAGGDTLTIYDEGTWTPLDAVGSALTQNKTSTYTRIGRQVTLLFDVSWTASTIPTMTGLPFTVLNNYSMGNVVYADRGTNLTCYAYNTSCDLLNNYITFNPSTGRFIGGVTYFI